MDVISYHSYKEKDSTHCLWVSSRGVKYKSHSNIDNQSEVKNQITHRTVEKWKTQFKNILDEIHDFSEVLVDFLKKVHIVKLQWDTRIGLEDAVLTGMSAGAIWGIKGTLLGIISKYMILENKPRIRVDPQFNYLLFHTYIDTLIKFRISSAVWMAIRILFGFVKAKVHKFLHSGYSKLYESFKRM
ncbi:DUF2953 domain-containing protein [Tepidibacillus marianensis]|uniref:DUF2953 domain-containing protein n=1 Tax=Tepidibacillus marianensis TaxID=3131995 RepID=UPI0030D58F31